MAIWEVVVGTESYSLSDRSPFDLVSATGLGLSPIRRIMQRGPQQHGETDLGYRIDSRYINLVLVAHTASKAQSDAARDLLAYIFGPRNSQPVVLRVTRDDGAVRQINCRVAGFLDFPLTRDERYGTLQRIGIQLVASEPQWYDPEPRQSAFALAGFSSGMAVPITIPLLFPAATGGDGTVQIVYGGSYDEYPLITIIGPVSDAYIENMTTGDIISLLGYTLTAGDSITIDLRYGQKSVTSAAGVNRIDALTDDSDLATFRLVSTLEVQGGRNQFRLSGLSLSEASMVAVTYYHRFLSL